MTASDPTSIATHLLSRPAPPLLPHDTLFSPPLKAQISAFKTSEMTKAALHLANDDIWSCHEIVEKHQGKGTADVMHAILHRREGDYWNSNYWWARVSHPLYPSSSSRSAAKSFTNRCEAVEKKGSGAGEEMQRVKEEAWEEIGRVVRWCLENEK